MERWKEYFSELLEPDIRRKKEEQQPGNTFTEDEALEENGYLDEDKILEAVGTLKMGKAAENDGITPEMIKKLGSQGMKMLQHLFNLAWKAKKIPEDWEVSHLKKETIGNAKIIEESHF